MNRNAIMTAVATNITALALDKPKATITVTPRSEDIPINTVDDLLLSRALTSPNTTLLAYPATPRGKTDYVDYSAKDLDRFVDHTAQKYAGAGLVPQVSQVIVYFLYYILKASRSTPRRQKLKW